MHHVIIAVYGISYLMDVKLVTALCSIDAFIWLFFTIKSSVAAA